MIVRIVFVSSFSAAHVMYECGMRLGTEVFNKEGLKRQAKCYLACINALKLVKKQSIVNRKNLTLIEKKLYLIVIKLLI